MATLRPRAIVAIALVAVLASTAAAQAPPLYRLQSPMIPPEAGQPLGLADFDGDGDLDLLTATTGICLNDGDGRFTLSSLGAGITAATLNLYVYTPMPVIAVGDLNGDGHPDVLVWDGSPMIIKQWRNQGSGSMLLMPQSIAFGTTGGVRSIALGDVDGDGDLDAVVAPFTANFIGSGVGAPLQLWRNDGAGAFTLAPYVLPASPVLTPQVALRDLDDDGDLDVVVCGEAGGTPTAAFLLCNDGTGSFPLTIPLPSVPGQNTFAIGDVNGDGLPDLAFDTLPSNQCSISSSPVIIGNGGNGSFSSMAGTLPLPLLGALPRLVDLDGDGHDELVRLTVQGASCHPLGAGLLPAASVAPLFPASLTIVPQGSIATAFGDLDSDGDRDIIAFTAQGSVVAFNDHAGHLLPVRGRLATPGSVNPGECDAVDFDGDGHPDLALGFSNCPGNATSPALHVAMNDGRGNLVDAPVLPVTGAPPGSVFGVRTFFDADGDSDLDCAAVIGGIASQVILVLVKSGAGYAVTQSIPGTVGAAIYAIKAGDLDGDGDQDLVFGTASWGYSPAATVIVKNAGGVFQPFATLPVAATQDLALVDVDGDGDLDLVQANSGGSLLYLNDGSGAMTLDPAFPSVNATSVTTADLDSDADPDLMLDNTVIVNLGGGLFFTPGFVFIPNWVANTMTFELVDVDGNSTPDLVDSKGRYYRNLGGVLSFTNPESLPAQLTFPIVHADFDGDGDEDLVARGPAILTNMTRQISPGRPLRPGRLGSLEVGAAPGTPWLLFASTGESWLPFLPYGTVRLDLGGAQLAYGGSIGSSGLSIIDGVVPSTPGIVGFTLYWQAVLYSPGGARFTGLEVTSVTAY